MLLPVRPQNFDRIQLRRVGGKILHPQAPSLLPDEVPYHAAAMARQSVPDDQQSAGNVSQQVAEKLDDLGAADGAGKDPEVKVPPGHSRHRRQRLPIEVILQHRSHSTWRPGAATMGPLAQPAFVDEDDGSAFFLGFQQTTGPKLPQTPYFTHCISPEGLTAATFFAAGGSLGSRVSFPHAR